AGIRPYGGKGVRLRVWRWQNGPGPLVWSEHGSATIALAFSRDSQRLATASANGDIQLWDAGTGRLEKSWSSAPDQVYALAFSGDGKALAGVLKEKASGLRLWDTLSGAERVHFPGVYGQLASVAFSPDGRLLVTGGLDGVRFWDPRTGA